MSNQAKTNFTAKKERFGTFAGVFTPTVLTILGIILFLRIGWVVGQAGLLGALSIIVLANIISLITGLCISSIATNMAIKTGGTYYMISRTLGLEIGGAIGIPLYLSQAISVAFYIIGFTEVFISVFPHLDARLLSTGLILVFGILAFVGADFVLKVQFVILAILATALVSVFAGGWGTWVSPELLTPATSTIGFWAVFAVFFPAVTGITVGISMSGDLKDPVKSIPAGTLAAIGVTAAVYLGTAIWLGTHATSDQLAEDTMILEKLARWPQLILLGAWASTLSSALGSILAAPRTLEAIAVDRVVPQMLGGRLGSATEPRVAVLLTTAIAVSVAWMGNLNFVASVITMFFLNTYGMINLTAGLERLAGNPSFRPRLNVPWWVSLAGGVGCYGAMFLIHTPATIVAILVSYGVYVLLKHRALRQNWGDIRSGVFFGLARQALVLLESQPPHPRNWRPNIVVFTRLNDGREELMEVGKWLSHGKGIVTFYQLLVGDLDELTSRGLCDSARKHLQKHLKYRDCVAFSGSAAVTDFYSGVLHTAQTHGVSGLEPNTCLMEWGDRLETQIAQLELVRRLIGLHKSCLLLKTQGESTFGSKKQIDVWWRGRDRNAELMLMLAHIISRSPPWEGAEIRVLRLLESEEAVEGVTRDLMRLLKTVRVEAEPTPVLRTEKNQSFFSAMQRVSTRTDLAFLGVPLPEKERLEQQARYLTDLLALPVSIMLVRSGEVEDVLS